MCQSYHNKTCVRVFRSSDLESKYAPALYEGEEDKVLYRYDGLYTVRAMWDPDGLETESSPEDGNVHTFFLMRQPKRSADCTPEEALNYNKISLQELWNEIQKRRGVRKPKTFAVPEPNMEVGRIGDKNNARRRPASTRRVLNNNNDDCTKKPTFKKKNVNVISSSYYGEGSSVFQSRNIYSSDSDSSDDSDEETESIQTKEEPFSAEVLNDGARPRRRSAAVARTYLKEVMHNRNGDQEKSVTPEHSHPKSSKKRSIWSTPQEKDDSKSSKRFCMNEESSDDDEPNDVSNHIVKEPSPVREIENEDDTVLKQEENVHSNAEPVANIEEESSKHNEVNKHASTNSVSRKAMQKRKPKTKSPKNIAMTEVVKNEEDDDKDTQYSMSSEEGEATFRDKVDPSKVEEGSRVNVEYRNTLFKATVRRVRTKDGKHQCLIHYDGNKKSNVHWIPYSMIHEILDEAPVILSQEPQPKRSRKRKLSDIKQNPAKKPDIENTKSSEAEATTLEDDYKFSIGSEVFVDFKKVLYRSTILNARKNKKGIIEYFVHYDGFKKTSDRWMKEVALHEINAYTTRRFNKERGVQSSANSNTDDSKTKSEDGKVGEEEQISNAKKSDLSSTKSTSSTKIPDLNSGSVSLDMSAFDSGVEFLPGSCVFIAKANALYLAKMIKRRKRGKGTEYFVQFDGMSSDHNEWISLSNIYELNPKTRKIYEKTKDERIIPKEEEEFSSSEEIDEEEEENEEKIEQQQQQKQEHEQAVKPASKSTSKVSTRGGGNKGKARQKKPQTSRLYDLQKIESGVDFLPGSTLFVQWKNGLFLGKMLKKRGMGDDMEYLIHCDGFNSSQDQWVSVALVFEINPQTKRVFNKQKKDNS